MEKFVDIDSYISSFDKEIRSILHKVKATIEKAAPKAVAGISYGMPAYKLNEKPLAYFAANKNHVGFYPTSSPINEFKDQLVKFKTSKGAVQFPYDQTLPVGLVTKMVKFRAKQINESSKAK